MAFTNYNSVGWIKSLAVLPVVVVILGILASTPALSQVGQLHGSGPPDFGDGVLALFSNVEHLIALVTVGLWASHRRHVFLRKGAGVVAVAGMLLGGGLAWTGLAVSGLEVLVPTLLITAAVLLTTYSMIPSVYGTPFIASLLAFHGFVYVSELPLGTSTVSHGLGFFSASLLFTTAITLACWDTMRQDGRIAQMIGVVTVLMGGLLVLG